MWGRKKAEVRHIKSLREEHNDPQAKRDDNASKQDEMRVVALF